MSDPTDPRDLDPVSRFPMLASQQQAFAAMLDGSDDLAPFATGGAARFEAYRANRLGNLCSALEGAYPTVRQLVGEEFFGGLARHYARAEDAHSGNLHDYGESFSEFLAGFAPAQSLPYLPDVARLDWAAHRAYYAPDIAPLDPARLSAVPPERLGEVRFGLHPAFALIESPYPLAEIWRVHQPDYVGEGQVDLGAGGGVVRVTRVGLAVTVMALSAAESAFWAAADLCFFRMLEAALEFDPAFHPDAPLMTALSEGWLTDVFLESA